jgi:indole-3-glycerol phosphate synthase
MSSRKRTSPTKARIRDERQPNQTSASYARTIFSAVSFSIIREYFDWAKVVIDSMRGTHPVLEYLFDAAYRVRP